MRVLVDSNILVSASFNTGGTPYRAFEKAITPPNQGVVCDLNLEELRWAYYRKFHDNLDLLEKFLKSALPALEVVHVPKRKLAVEDEIRDITDRPIFRAAIRAKVDIILTGDKDFLESGIKRPLIMTAAEFVGQSVHSRTGAKISLKNCTVSVLSNAFPIHPLLACTFVLFF
jgi:predicted nucleic acid-binding protein